MAKKNNKKNTFYHLPILCGIIFMLVGCSGREIETKVDLDKKIFFDLKGYMESEKVRLSSVSSFSKTVFVNNEKEQKQTEKIELEKELKPFSDSDINRPAWSDKYKIDSIYQNNNELKSLVYTAKDEKLKTQKLAIEFNGREVALINISNTTKSSVANTFQLLTYEPRKGFSIENTQDVVMMDENRFKVEVLFQ